MYRIGQEEIDACKRVIESRELFKINGAGREVFHFEEELKEKFGVDHAICMTNGHAGLASSLVGMGVGPGDEVIVPGYTYIATAMAVISVGAIPVIAEVDATLTLDPDDVEKKISPYTKAIIPVHMRGFPCNMDRIMAIAKAHHLLVLEDACQAVGSKYHGKMLGSIGDAGALSFNFYKIITAGEGGALVTNDRGIFERGLIYHDSSAIAFFGNQLETVEAEQFCGTEYRVGEFTGAILREQLKKLDGIVADLRKNAAYLRAGLGKTYRFNPSNDEAGDACGTLSLFFDTTAEARAFEKKAKDAGIWVTLPIDTGKHVYPNWTPIMNHNGAYHPAFDPFKMEANKNLNHAYTADMCPNTLDLLSRSVFIDVNPDATTEQLDKMIAALA